MLFLPLHRTISARYFPWVTLALLSLNCVVFFGPQHGDQARLEQAVEYYFVEQLDRIEFPLFSQHLEQRGERDQVLLWQSLTEPEAAAAAWPEAFGQRHYALLMLEADLEFQQQLRDEILIVPGDQAFDAWRVSRDGYQALRDATFGERFQLSFDEPRPLQFISSMFLHGSLAHLLGNMLFLVLLGLLVEGALGRGVYAVSYLACGVVAASASFAVHAGEPTGLVGASGAIAGLMGLYTTLFGRRRVRFFYWVVVYFDYVKKPAIYLLPIWLGWEVLQFFLTDSNVAYEAHAAGIASGAALGWLYHRWGWVDTEYLDLEVKTDRRSDGLSAARGYLARLEVTAAKRELRELAVLYPQDTEVLSQYFNACALRPESAELHDAAKQLFGLTENNASTDQSLIESFQKYRQLTAGKLKLPATTLALMGRRMARQGEHAGAEQLIRLLLEKAPKTAGLADAVDALVAAYRMQGQEQRATELLQARIN